mmetsp:Transcript_22282/g.50211  ORF Transcript_22282/g.50211 Transcript_22282/m.50211 type:complete len:596 (+) Transcript_22282:61-1848(+)
MVAIAEVSVDKTGVNPRLGQLQQRLCACAINFFHRHIRTDENVGSRMDGNMYYQVFVETQYHSKKDLPAVYIEHADNATPGHVSKFILTVLKQGLFDLAALVISVIYLSRFKQATGITLHSFTWRTLFLTALLVADKTWEDHPVRNSSLSKLFPVLTCGEVNRLELCFLLQVRFNVVVEGQLFTSFCEKLLGEVVNPEIERCVAESAFGSGLLTSEIPHHFEVLPSWAPAPVTLQQSTRNTLHVVRRPAADASNHGRSLSADKSASEGGCQGREQSVERPAPVRRPVTAGPARIQTFMPADARRSGPTAVAAPGRGTPRVPGMRSPGPVVLRASRDMSVSPTSQRPVHRVRAAYISPRAPREMQKTTGTSVPDSLDTPRDKPITTRGTIPRVVPPASWGSPAPNQARTTPPVIPPIASSIARLSKEPCTPRTQLSAGGVQRLSHTPGSPAPVPLATHANTARAQVDARLVPRALSPMGFGLPPHMVAGPYSQGRSAVPPTETRSRPQGREVPGLHKPRTSISADSSRASPSPARSTGTPISARPGRRTPGAPMPAGVQLLRGGSIGPGQAWNGPTAATMAYRGIGGVSRGAVPRS